MSAVDSSSNDLAPSELGTKKFWESRYTQEINNFNDHGDEGEVWFGTSAESRIVQHFKSKNVPKSSSIVDLGCGNGSMLRRLRKLGYSNLCGVDYCESAVKLAKSIDEQEEDSASSSIDYSTLDLCCAHGLSSDFLNKTDLLVDKGTLDAIALSEDSKENIENYLRNVHSMLAVIKHADCKDAVLNTVQRGIVLCSCNFTRDELIAIVEGGNNFKFDYSIDAKSSFQFGGQRGQTTVVCVFYTVN